jgi:hypothetical protein
MSVNWMNCLALLGTKNVVYILTEVDRETHCIVGWDVVLHRIAENLQAMLDRAPLAAQFHSDAFPVYNTLVYDPVAAFQVSYG